MRTHDIRSALDAVKDGALGDLAPAERAGAVVRYAGRDRDEAAEQLHSTAPRQQYEGPDPEFIAELHRYREHALYALWELETGAWRFLYEARDRIGGGVEEAAEDDVAEAERLAAEFLANYRAWARYAAEDVDATLREFLRHPVAPEAATHVDRIEYAAALADGSAFDDVGGKDDVGWAPEAVAIEGGEWSVDALADRKYATITGGVES